MNSQVFFSSSASTLIASPLQNDGTESETTKPKAKRKIKIQSPILFHNKVVNLRPISNSIRKTNTRSRAILPSLSSLTTLDQMASSDATPVKHKIVLKEKPKHTGKKGIVIGSNIILSPSPKREKEKEKEKEIFPMIQNPFNHRLLSPPQQEDSSPGEIRRTFSKSILKKRRVASDDTKSKVHSVDNKKHLVTFGDSQGELVKVYNVVSYRKAYLELEEQERNKRIAEMRNAKCKCCIF